MKKILPLILSLILLVSLQPAFSQTTYNFNSGATLSAPIWSFWKTRAVITIDGVRYQMDCGGNGSFANSATEGVSNSASLKKDGSGGDQFTLQREDGQPFQFYGFWVKHQSMNSYSQFMALPPWYTITYNLASGGTQTDRDMTAKQGNNTALTTSAITYTKDLAVTSVSIQFNAIMYFWIDDIKVGPVAAVAAPTISSHPVNRVLCVGNNTTFSVTAENASSYQWQINTGSGFTNISNNTYYSGATTSTLTLTNAITVMNGYQYRCVVGGSSSVTSNAASLSVSGVNVATSQTNIACNGTATGALSVTASSGTAPYTYLWSTGATTSTITGLSVGPYSVTVTDALGCSTTRNFTIIQPTAINATTSQTNITCNGGSNGSASVSVTGGVGPYTYSWAPMGGTAATATGLVAGTYTVTITDQYGCQTTRNFTITQPAAMQVGTSQTNVSCNGASNGSASVTVSGGTAPYTYLWSNGATTPTASGLTAGTYSVTITDVNGCQSNRNFTLTQPAAVTATVNKTTETICSGSSTSIELIGSNGTSFNWTVAAVSGEVAGYSNGSGETIFQTLTGNGKINYTITPSNGICTGTTIQVAVTVNALTAISSQPISIAIEEGESTSFEITAANATSHQWQVNTGNGFVNLSNNAVYSGVTSSRLIITHASGELDGSNYRCIATGLCATAAISNEVSLAVNVKATQSISFETIPAQNYGDQFSLLASSSSGLSVSFSSSDPSIAEISNGILYAKNAGQVTITANQAGNQDYKPAPALGQLVTIQKRILTIERNTTVALEKTYDGNHLLTLPQNALTIQNTVNGDVLEATAAAHFISETAGINKVVTIDNFQLTGDNLENYVLSTSSISTTGEINKKTISAQIKNNAQLVKTYDGSSNLELESNPVELTGLVGSDEVFVQTAAAFDNKNAGTNKTVTLRLQALVGNDKDNYELSSSTLTTPGTIQPKMVNVTQTTQRGLYKTYDGTTTMNPNDLSLEISGTVAGDELSVLAAADFESKNVGTNIPVDIHSLQLDGKDKDNYQLTSQHTTAVGTIEPYVLTLTFSQDHTISKIYDGTTKAAISKQDLMLPTLFGEDEVSIELPAFASYDTKNAGTGKQITVQGITLSGKDAGNYTLEAASVNGSVGTILPKAATVKATAATKVYGSPDPAFSFTTEGVLEGETLEGKLSRMEGKNAGVYDITIGSLSGGTNYTIESFEKASLTITKADLLIKVDSKLRKQGQPNPAFTFQYIGLAGGDQPTDLSTAPTATTTAVTNSPIGIFEIKVTGAASPNYNISYQNGQLTIVPASNQNSVQAWSSGSGQLQVRIYADRAQKASIVLYTVNGQTLILEARQLNQGINTFTLRTGHLTTGTYILGVYGQYIKEADKLNIK